MKKQLAIAAFSLLIPFSQAANANDNDSLKKDSIEVVRDKVDVYRGLERFEKPVFHAGDNTDAARSSFNGKMAIHIFVPSNWEKSGEEIAQKMANAFADTTYTDYRVNIAAFHEATDRLDQPVAAIYMDGGHFHVGERAHFTLKEIGDRIQKFAVLYLKRHGIDKRVPKDAPIMPAEPTKD